MDEHDLRKEVVETATEYIGCVKGDPEHRDIVDIYNSHRPLARSYRLKYSDDWCAGFVSAVSILCNLTDIIPTEVGAQEQLVLFQKLGRYTEEDDYVPQIGDVIFYSWSDSGNGDCVARANHVGIVSSVVGTVFNVIEGNMTVNGVSTCNVRCVHVGARYIRGFGLPDYAGKVQRSVEYINTDELNLRAGPSMTATIIAKMAYRDKVMLLFEENGWACVEYAGKVGYCGASYLTDVLPPLTYVTTTSVNMRTGAGVLHRRVMVVPGGDTVWATGDQDTVLGTLWREVSYKGNRGWVSGKYLR